MIPHHSSVLFETRAQGKLLLTGEYFVLDGALALALPVRYGQTLRVAAAGEHLHWQSLDQQGAVWFAATFALPALEIRQTTDQPTAEVLGKILLACQRLRPDFLTDSFGYSVTTQNDFPRDWGLGTSSTLIAALARWAGVDPYLVLFTTLGGSGYDLACAYASGPIYYQLENGAATVRAASFYPAFAGQLYFVYLGKKQDSRAGIGHYRHHVQGNKDLIEKISALTRRCVAATHLMEFEAVLSEHERLVGEALDLPRAKDLFFKDYWGAVKSLGAWGGDFVLVTSDRPMEETRTYFNEKGYTVFIPYRDMTAFSSRLSS